MKDFLFYISVTALGMITYLILYFPAYLFYKSKLTEESIVYADVFFAVIPYILYLLLFLYKDRQGFNYLKACTCTAVAPALFLLLTFVKSSLNTRTYFVWALAVSCICAIVVWLFLPKQGLDRLI